MTISLKKAAQFINQAGLLLVYPIDNKREPDSLWFRFFPKSEMRWEWDSGGDDRVADLWHLKTELSTTKKVVYTKWYRGRATYFSRELFVVLLRSLNPHLGENFRNEATLSEPARRVLSVLRSESPLSTKELKRLSDLKGKANERIYDRALKELWSRLLIVAFGEVEDGAFPSLAVGATDVLFEDLWAEARELSLQSSRESLARFKLSPSVKKFLSQIEKQLSVQLKKPAKTHKAKTRSEASRAVVDFKDL